MSDERSQPYAAWSKLVESLAEAGARMESSTAALSAEERADGFRALARGLANQLGRLEVDDAHPELAPFNLWRQKFYMDNPEFRYWVGEITDRGIYRIDGTAPGAAFVSINVYAGSSLEAQTVVRRTSEDLDIDSEGRFALTLGGEQADARGQWAALPTGANMVWVRQFYGDPKATGGTCEIVRLDDATTPPMIEADRFSRRLARTGATMAQASKVIARGASHAAEPPNSIREWSEMQGGAVYTEPGIHYQRGAWELGPDEALVIEGQAPAARHRSVLLYSRFLNSLDYHNRQVSLAGERFKVEQDGRFRVVIAARDPGTDNWLDTEGRPYGLFVIRWLQPQAAAPLPSVRVAPLSDLGAV